MTVNILCGGSVGISGAGAQRKFEILAYSGGKLRVNGFGLPVVIDLSGLDVRAGLPVLIDHENTTKTTLGQVTDWENDGRRLVIRGVVTGASEQVQAVLGMSDRGHQWEASVGAVAAKEDQELVDAGQSRFVNGQSIEGPFILARRSIVRETSVLPMGSDPSTSVNLAAAAAIMKGSGMPTFEEWVTSLGQDPAGITEAMKDVLLAQYKLTMQAPAVPTEAPAESVEASPDGGEPEEKPGQVAAAAQLNIRAAGVTGAATAARDAIAGEYQRAAEIRTRCSAAGEEFIAAAIRNNWAPDHAELQMLRQQNRTRAPAGHVRSHEAGCTIEALQGAMMIRAGLRLDDPAFQNPRFASRLPEWLRAGLNTDVRQRAMENAHRYSGLSMVDLCREAIRLDRGEVPVGREEMIQAALSGGSLTNIFTTNVNTQILATYESFSDDTTLAWTREVEVNDFKLNERPRMTIGPSLKKMPRGIPSDQADRSDVAESYKISRYGLQFNIDEQDIIDDTFGAMGDIPKQFGEAAASMRPDLVYSILLANPSLNATARALFNATDGNLAASSALTIDTLFAVVTKMFNRQENGRNLGLRATHLLIPPILEKAAYNALQSQSIVLAGTAGSVTERGDANVMRSKQIEIVPEPRLQNGVLDPDSGLLRSGSTSSWYLACARAHTIEVAYRSGTGRAPSVRSWPMSDEGMYGIGFDVKLDIGAKAMDWKGLDRADQ